MIIYLMLGAMLAGVLLTALTFWITTIFLIQREIQRSMLRRSDMHLLLEDFKKGFVKDLTEACPGAQFAGHPNLR